MASFLNEKYFNNTNFKLVLEYDAVMNQQENYHSVTYYLYFQSLNGYSGGGGSSNGYINSVLVGSTTTLGKNQKLLLGTKTETIYHNTPNADGTQNAYYSASISSPWSKLGTASVEGTLVLPKINRESTWGFTSWQMDDIENPLILKINKYNASYTNKVLIENLQMTEVVKTVNNAVNNMQITFTESELNQIYTLGNNENLTNLRFYLTLFTYDSSGNQIGEKQRTLMNAYLHDANPTFTYSIEETDDKVIDLLESSSADYIIKNVSKPKITVTSTPKKGATISTVSIVNGTQANANENPYIFQDVQTGTFTIVVTDSRGLTSTQTITKNLVNYTPVYINSYSFERESQVSSNIILNADVTCYSGSFNSITNVPQIFYKVGSSSDYVEITSGFTFSNNKITFSNYNLGSILPYTQSSTLYLYVVDLLTEDVENSVVTKGVATFEAGEHDFQVNGDFFIADTNRENKVNILEQINLKSGYEYLRAGISANQNVSSMYLIDLNKVVDKNTDRLILSGGGIMINDDNVSLVEVSGSNMIGDVKSAGYVWGIIRRFRGTQEYICSSSIQASNPTMYWAGTPITPIIVSCQKGDIFRLQADSTIQGFARSGDYETFLTVRIIK